MNAQLITICVILITSLRFSAYGQNNEDSLIKSNKVKSIVELEWTKRNKNSLDTIGYKLFDSKFRLVEEYSKNHPYLYKYEYNSQSLLVKKIKFNNRKIDEIDGVWKYKYDDKQRLIEEKTRWNSNLVYEYDKKNQLIAKYWGNKKKHYKSFKQKFYDSGELYEEVFEEKHNKSAYKVRRFDKCGNLIYLHENGHEKTLPTEYVFLSLCSDLPIEKKALIDTIYNSEDNSFLYRLENEYQKTSYFYDSLKNLVKTSYFRLEKQDSISGSEENLYDKYGRLIEYSELSYWAECNYSTEFHEWKLHQKFEYYENGLLKNIYFLDENSKVRRILEYKIEYYN